MAKKDRVRDVELAVGALAGLVERIIVADKKWKGEERKKMLDDLMTIRALVNVETVSAAHNARAEELREANALVMRNADVVARAAGVKEKVEPEKYEGKRFFVDLPSGDAYSTDDAEEVRRMYETGQLTNVYDRFQKSTIIYQGAIYATGTKALGYDSAST